LRAATPPVDDGESSMKQLRKHSLLGLLAMSLAMVALSGMTARFIAGEPLAARPPLPAPFATADAPSLTADAAADPSTADLAAACARAPLTEDPQIGRVSLDRAKAKLAGLDDDAKTDFAVPLQMDLAKLQLQQSEFDAMFQTLDQIADGYERAAQSLPNTFLGLRAQANLRAAETANCLNSTNPFVCLLNRPAGAAYRVQNYTLDAIADLEASLQRNGGAVESRWLLNIAHMTIGTYPDGVPEQWRIPPEVFASERDAPRFVDVGRDLGVAPIGLAGSGMMEDFDGDGLLDLLETTLSLCDHAAFYHNNGDGTFTDRSKASGVSRQLGGLGAQHTDYDNDGHVDVLINRGGWQFDHILQRRSLLRNNGDGTFSDVTRTAGLAEPVYPSQASAWADYDGDGDLDVYIANEAGTTRIHPSQLFRNNGDGTFTDVAPAAGVVNGVMAKGAAWGDYDNDGDPDLYVSNIGPNRFYRNNGDGTFTDVAPELGVTEPSDRSFSTWFWDYDNDGWLDIFVAGFQATVEQVARGYLGQPTDGERSRLYRNTGRGGFEDVTAAVGLDRVLLPMGSNFGDIDNDGFEDIYLGTGDPSFATLVPNVMFWNDGGQRFYDVTAAAGVGHLPKGHGIAFGDIDRDGDQDIYLDAGGFYPSDVSPNALFENPGTPGRHWLTVKLTGTRANRAAIGARMKLVVDDGGREREFHRMVGTGSSFGANSLQAEIGLGGATEVRSLEILWPGSGAREVFSSIPADRFIEITEGQGAYNVLDRPAVPFQRRDPGTAQIESVGQP